jgi:hypothetical protein
MIAKSIATTLAFSAVAFAGFVALRATPANAEMDLAKERSTAAQHAGLAAKAGNMKATQMHLHHVINCLVGPKGQGFDSKELNPCKDQGNGVIPDTTDITQKALLNQALAKANAGLKETDMAAAQKDATEAQAMLSPK